MFILKKISIVTSTVIIGASCALLAQEAMANATLQIIDKTTPINPYYWQVKPNGAGFTDMGSTYSRIKDGQYHIKENGSTPIATGVQLQNSNDTSTAWGYTPSGAVTWTVNATQCPSGSHWEFDLGAGAQKPDPSGKLTYKDFTLSVQVKTGDKTEDLGSVTTNNTTWYEPPKKVCLSGDFTNSSAVTVTLTSTNQLTKETALKNNATIKPNTLKANASIHK